MQRYPIAVLGAGPAGRNYIKELAKEWSLEVVGFTNRSPEPRAVVSAETKVPGFTDFAELMAKAARKPAMVVIATANTTHKDFAIQALQAGLHVFCEKPMAMNLDDCQTMLLAEQRSGKVLQIGFEYRYGTVTGRIKELLDQGFFGDLRSLDVTDSRGHWWPETPDTPVEKVWRLNRAIGGGPILHCGIHELDLMRHYAGEVTALQAFVSPRSIPFYPDQAPDHLNLQLRFASGATGSFTLYHTIAPTWYRPLAPHTPNYHQVPGHGLDFTLSGTGGSALVNVYRDQIHLSRYDVAERETRFIRTEHYDHQNGNASHHNTTRMIIDFAHRVRDGRGAIHSAEDSLKTTRLGFTADAAVQEALKTGWASGVISLAG